MTRHFLIRLDDACPTMDRAKWQHIEDILDKYDVKPMAGVIPHNEDPKQEIDSVDESFWDKVSEWGEKGWAIALHGYNHCYTSNGGLNGLNPMWERSEFAGLSLEEQKEKIRKGVAIMREHGLNPRYFFAPSHTFDENTLTALWEESDVRIISDTIGRHPYKRGEFYFIPQISGHCVKMPFSGVYTFCFHPNTMSEFAFKGLEAFLGNNHEHFISFDEIELAKYGNKLKADRILSWAFFSYRKLRDLK